MIDCIGSGANITKSIRAAVEPLMKENFGEAIMDELFMVSTTMVTMHLQKAKAKYPIIVIFLKVKHLKQLLIVRFK